MFVEGATDNVAPTTRAVNLILTKKDFELS